MSENIITIMKPVTKVVEVVERGPQGLAGAGAVPIPQLKFITATADDFLVSDDINTPSVFPGMSLDPGSTGVTLNSQDGSITNETNRDIPQVFGTISFQPFRSGGGGTTLLYLWSERTSDGVTWTQNDRSLRSIEVGSSGETFKTSISGVSNWKAGERVRFKLATDAGANLRLAPPSITTVDGNIDGYSVVWELFEL